MSGLGLFKKGKAASRAPFETSRSFSAVNYDDFEKTLTSAGILDEDDQDIGFEDDNSSMCCSIESGTQHTAPEPPEELKLPHECVKNVMKLLKAASKSEASAETISEAITSVTKLAGTTYAVKSELGERGVCEALILLLERNKDDPDTSCDIMRAMKRILISDDENKVRLAKLGGCKLVINIMQLHTEDPCVLEVCCELMVEFGNGKFASMMEAEYNRQEHVRELKSRAMKRTTLTPNRISAMTPTAAAAATKALEDLKMVEDAERELKRLEVAAAKTEHKDGSGKKENKADSKDCKDSKDEKIEQGAIWDNRLELYRVGACDALINVLHNLVKRPHSVDHNVTNLESIFEDENVVVAACYAIASLSTNSLCAKAFAQDPQMSVDLCTLLMHFKHWSLTTATSWAVVNLCADGASGNREKLGAAHCCESICRGLVDITNKQAELVQVAGFDRLLEYYVWALLNLLVNNPKNQHRVRMLEREGLFRQLAEAPWTKAGVKDKAQRVLKILSTGLTVTQTTTAAK